MDIVGLSAQISEFIANRAEARLDKFDKDAEKQRKTAEDSGTLAELELKLETDRTEIECKYAPANWLSDAAIRAKQIQMVTHALKFTHTDARGSSFYFPGGSLQVKGMVDGEVFSTASLTNPVIDTVGNAAALDVAALLQLDHDGTTLIQHIEQGDPSVLRPFAQDEKQLTEWQEAFKQVSNGNELSSHKLAKQLYFPLTNGQYHLLAPLYSSSLAHALNSRIAATRYPDEIKLVRKAKKEGKYHAAPVIDYPDTAVRTFGGTKPQNVSQLNSSQGGKSFLLSCAPPNWEVQTKPPFGVKSIFSRNHFGYRVRKEVWSLQQYLLKKPDTNNKLIRDQRAERVDQVIDQLVQYAAEIQNLIRYAGWSALPDCKLSRAEQLWLDPHRAELDNVFAQDRDKNDWQAVIADLFARWLNSRLKHEKLTMGDAEHSEWKKLALEVIG